MNFMVSKSESIQLLKKHFKENKTATMSELLDLLGVTTRMSIFRRLSDLGYISSCSHKGQYYTLPSVIFFNSEGLYHYDKICFSQYGNLKKTIVKLVESSNFGYTHKELSEQLKLEVHDTLLVLINSHKLARQKINSQYVYFSNKKEYRRKQLTQRQSVGKLRKVNGDISKILIIEVLVSIIRANQLDIDTAIIISDLKMRDIVVTENEIEQVLLQFDLKKTPDLG